MHEENPNLLVGYYSVLPVRNYWDALKGPGSSEYQNWQSLNQRAMDLASHVDVLFPSLYTFYADYDYRDGSPRLSERGRWVQYAVANLSEARRFGKPILPFIWPRYHPSEPWAYQEIGDEFWRLQLETVKEHADGVVIWAGGDATGVRLWQNDVSWWQETKSFISSVIDPSRALDVRRAVMDHYGAAFGPGMAMISVESVAGSQWQVVVRVKGGAPEYAVSHDILTVETIDRHQRVTEIQGQNANGVTLRKRTIGYDSSGQDTTTDAVETNSIGGVLVSSVSVDYQSGIETAARHRIYSPNGDLRLDIDLVYGADGKLRSGVSKRFAGGTLQQNTLMYYDQQGTLQRMRTTHYHDNGRIKRIEFHLYVAKRLAYHRWIEWDELGKIVDHGRAFL